MSAPTPVITLPIADTALTPCESLLSHIFSNKLLLLEALNTTGYTLTYSSLSTSTKNANLAILGTNLLRAELCKRWYDSELSAKDFNTIDQSTLSTPALANLGRAKGLEKFIVKNPGQDAISDKMVATAVTAIIGAVYKDAGEDAMKALMARLRITHKLLDQKAADGDQKPAEETG